MDVETPPAPTCTFPSGDGSLRSPCQAHGALPAINLQHEALGFVLFPLSPAAVAPHVAEYIIGFDFDEVRDVYGERFADFWRDLVGMFAGQPATVALPATGTQQVAGQQAPSHLATSEGGRRFIAEFFATELRRHDFADYISTRLAADFACALAQHLAARQSRTTLLPDDPRIVKKIADEIERGKLDHPGFYRNTQLAEALRRMLDAALTAPPAQGIDLVQPAPSVTRYRIEDAPGLDPVTVYVENYEPGKGRTVVTCYASAWTAFWGAMGADTTLEQFVASCSAEYVADNMVWGADTKKSTNGHADKVAAAVVALFKSQRVAAPGVGNV